MANGKNSKRRLAAIPTADRPSEDEIRKRAYELYLARDGGPGSELDDWLKAEMELSPEKAADA